MSKRLKGTKEEYDQALDALIRIQRFDPKELVQTERLGSENHFSEAVEPAEMLLSLFQSLPDAVLVELPDNQLSVIKQAANSTYNIFDEIKSFDLGVGDNANRRRGIIERLKGEYQGAFGKIHPLISFSMARTVDFNRLESDGRAAVQSVRDETSQLRDYIEKVSREAEGLLEKVRQSAAEEGVTRQAKYFGAEAAKHEDHSKSWKWAAILASIILFVYSLLALLFFPTVDYLQPDSVAEAIQVTASKILVFAVLAYALIQCVKNYAAQKHNAVMNKHRQNALLTYTTLAESGSSPEARDTILQHAAAAIYAPGDTGFMKNEERGYGGNPIVGFAPQQIIGGGSN